MVPCSHGLEEWLRISGICEKSGREVSGHGTSSSTEFTWESSGMGDSNLWRGLVYSPASDLLP